MSAITLDRSYIYSHGLYRRTGAVIATALTLVTAGGLFVIGWPAAALFGSLLLATLMFLYPRQGLYGLIGTVFIVEGSSGLPFVSQLSPLYDGIDNSVPGSPPVSPLEIGMIILILGTVRLKRATGELKLGEFFWPLALITAAILAGLARGAMRGGDFITGYHEVRALLYLLPMYFVTVNLLQERRHFVQLTVAVVVATTAMAFGALWTHFTLVRPGDFRGVIDLGFAHENAVFAGLLTLLAISMLVWARKLGPRFILLIPGVVAMAAILIMKRRVGVIALDAGVLLLCLTLLRNNWRLFMVVMPVLAVVSVIYLGMYWNATGGLGQGARAFRTVIGEESAAEDISSKNYREIEAANVEYNIRWQPFFGLGFGTPYEWPTPLPDLTSFWPFQRFIPHNTVLWTWMKGGIITFMLTMAFFGYAMMRGLALARRPLEPLLRAWTVVAAASVLMVFLFGWQDLGLNSLRTMAVFGVCVGLITVLGAMPEQAQPPDEQSQATPPRAGPAPV